MYSSCCYAAVSSLTLVHGFEKYVFSVEEGDRLNALFAKDVKGVSAFNSLLLPMLGTITSEAPDESKGIE